MRVRIVVSQDLLNDCSCGIEMRDKAILDSFPKQPIGDGEEIDKAKDRGDFGGRSRVRKTCLAGQFRDFGIAVGHQPADP